MPKTTDNEEEANTADLHTAITSRLDAMEKRLLRVEQAAHTSHDLALGPAELKAITNAVLPHVNKHLGISGHPARGDQG